jgi:hypothetical protein
MLTPDVSIDRSSDTLFRAVDADLTKCHAKLADGSDSIDRRDIKQHTSARIEHKAKETPKKTGETACTGESRKQVVAYTAMSKSFFEVLAKCREGYRQKRYPLMFDTARDRFMVTRGAHSTPLPDIVEKHMRERDQAFHLRPP